MVIMSLKASPEQIRANQERRRSNAAVRHLNKARMRKYPGKGHRNDWRKTER
jgi:hypothetical protein